MNRNELKTIVEKNTQELYGMTSCDSVKVKIEEHNSEDAILRDVCKNNEPQLVLCQSSQKGKSISDEHRKKISNALKGKPLSEKTKERMRQNNSRRANVYQYSMEGELVRVWASTRQVERETGWSASLIAKVCRGCPGKKTAYGYVWKYKPLNEPEQELSIKVEKTYT